MTVHYNYAAQNILCMCPGCFCPYSTVRYPNGPRTGSKGKYSFVYINNKKKYMYVSIGKCASTTIRSAFFDGDASSRLTAVHPLNEYFKFTFVRNPWDRMISNWKMFTTVPFRIRQLKTMTNKDLSKLEDFIDFAADTPNHHWLPQVTFLSEPMDFIGRVENSAEDLQTVSKKIGVPVGSNKKLNASSRSQKYTKYYTTSLLIDKVATLYSEDIERFEYQFGD